MAAIVLVVMIGTAVGCKNVITTNRNDRRRPTSWLYSVSLRFR